MSQRRLAKKDLLRQELLFYGTMPPFQMGVQIRTSWRQFHRRVPDGLQDPGERFTKLGVSIVKQITAALQKTNVRQTHVSRHLSHPAQVG